LRQNQELNLYLSREKDKNSVVDYHIKDYEDKLSKENNQRIVTAESN